MGHTRLDRLVEQLLEHVRVLTRPQPAPREVGQGQIVLRGNVLVESLGRGVGYLLRRVDERIQELGPGWITGSRRQPRADEDDALPVSGCLPQISWKIDRHR